LFARMIFGDEYRSLSSSLCSLLHSPVASKYFYNLYGFTEICFDSYTRNHHQSKKIPKFLCK
jgi:hypothetical protein